MANNTKTKTPSPRVLAAQWIADQLDPDRGFNENVLNQIGGRMIPEAIVSDAKRAKVKEQILKLSASLLVRTKKTLNRHYGRTE